MKRVYGKWAGNPSGVPEDEECCIEAVWDKFSWGGRQYSRKRGYGPDGLYCKQHAKKHEQNKNEEE